MNHLRFFSAWLLLSAAAACGGRTVVPSPRPGPVPGVAEGEVVPGEPSAKARRITRAVTRTAVEVIGTPYLWGGSGENGFDCSGLIQYAYGLEGINLPRISRDQLRAGSYVLPRMAALTPGDILGFSRGKGGTSSHVGLYLGQGQFIHSGSRGVRRSSLTNPYWKERLVAARRIVR